MIRATPETTTHRCGPLEIIVDASDEALANVARSSLDLYAPIWPDVTRTVRVALARGKAGTAARGAFLQCGRMQVDRTAEGYAATTRSGIAARGRCTMRDDWCVTVPHGLKFGEPEICDVEDILMLACTVGWREEGWVAVHAGAAVKNGSCALICAPSGGGKTTLMTALLLRGWKTMGDDKLLLGRHDGNVCVAALLETFNVHPRSGRWFEPLGSLERLPRYSAWTEKRRVRVEQFARGAMVERAIPTHLVRIERTGRTGAMRVRAMGGGSILAELLKQIVIPNDRNVAASIVQTAARASRGIRGIVLEVGEDAYVDPGQLSVLEEVLA